MGPDKYVKNYIDGALVPASSGQYLDLINPATGKVYAQQPMSQEEDIELAMEAAQRAFPKWSKQEADRRFRIMLRIADIIEQYTAAFARAEAIDTGKPYAMAVSADIPRAFNTFRYFASSGMHFQTPVAHLPGEAISYTLQQPLGVVLCSPHWGYPLQTLCEKVAPALAMGNCVVIKSPELAPMSAYLFAKACVESGIPQGVVNILHGTDNRLLPLLVNQPQVQAVAFTGSQEEGTEIAQWVAPYFKKTYLRLSGKNPNLIFADCNFDQTMIGTLRSSFSNNGQTIDQCSRIFVERPLYQQFLEEFIKRSSFVKVGDPFSSVTDLGALISHDHLERVLSVIALAEVEGGKLLTGGRPKELSGDLEGGYFLRPTIIEGLDPTGRASREQIFGPVVSLHPFDMEEEAIQLANNPGYNQVASVWTSDGMRANRMAEQLRAGTVWLNAWLHHDPRTPYGGTVESGTGRLGGIEALRFFSATKSVALIYGGFSN